MTNSGRLGTMTSAFALLTLMSATGAGAQSSTTAPPDAATIALTDASETTSAERGAYVAAAAGCVACHSADGGARFAGGLLLDTPFGDLATPNITPDKATGIGDWTFEDFRRVLYEGVGKDGEQLYPGMPYDHYTKMFEPDVKSLWAYLQTLEAVDNEVKVNRLPFPFNIRENLLVWKALFFTEGRFAVNPDKSETWNRGAYIVEAMTHCGACHTPRDALGGSVTSRRFQGATLDEWYAPDISNGPDSIIADWSVDRLAAFLSGESVGNHVALGNMAWVVEDLSKLQASDVRAVATYMKDQHPTNDDAPAPVAPMSAAMKAEGGAVFAENCVTCHQADGKGAPGLAASLVDAGGVIAREPDNVISVMLEGVAPSDAYGVMPSFRDTLTPRELAAVANYVRTSWGNTAPANATATKVATLRHATTVSAGVESGALCPNVADGAVGEATQSLVNQLAKTHGNDVAAIGEADLAKVAADYLAAEPNATDTDAVIALGGSYCHAVAADGGTASDVARTFVMFSNAMLAALDDK